MNRKIVYWTSTALIAVALLSAITYLIGGEQVISGFAKAGYPQHLESFSDSPSPPPQSSSRTSFPCAQGMGVRRCNIRVDHGFHLGVHGRRTDLALAARAPGTAGRLLCDQARGAPLGAPVSGRLTKPWLLSARRSREPTAPSATPLKGEHHAQASSPARSGPRPVRRSHRLSGRSAPGTDSRR